MVGFDVGGFFGMSGGSTLPFVMSDCLFMMHGLIRTWNEGWKGLNFL